MIRVEVTQADIDAGCPCDVDCCPVARAIERASAPFFDGFGQGRVFDSTGSLFVEFGHLCVEAPEEVCRFVEAFDEFDPLYPEYSTPKLEEFRHAIRPFSFDVPDLDSPEWKEQCHYCDGMFDPDELDEDGFCDGCLAYVDGRDEGEE